MPEYWVKQNCYYIVNDKRVEPIVKKDNDNELKITCFEDVGTPGITLSMKTRLYQSRVFRWGYRPIRSIFYMQINKTPILQKVEFHIQKDIPENIKFKSVFGDVYIDNENISDISNAFYNTTDLIGEVVVQNESQLETIECKYLQKHLDICFSLRTVEEIEKSK